LFRITVFTNKKREGIDALVCAVSIYVAETPETSIKDQVPPLPIKPLGVVAYGIDGQPFSKHVQLYIIIGSYHSRVAEVLSNKLNEIGNFPLTYMINPFASLSYSLSTCVILPSTLHNLHHHNHHQLYANLLHLSWNFSSIR